MESKVGVSDGIYVLSPGVVSAPAYTASSPFTVTFAGASPAATTGMDHVELWYKKGSLGTWTYSGHSSTAASGSFSFTLPGEATYFFAMAGEDDASARTAALAGDGDCSTIFDADSAFSPSGRTFMRNEYLYPGGPLVRATAHQTTGAQFRSVSYHYGLEGELLGRAGSTEPVAYEYDSAYKIIGFKDGNGIASGKKTAYDYDLLGRLTKVTYPDDPDHPVEYRYYTEAGSLQTPTPYLASLKDGKGVVKTFAYNDPEGLTTAVAYSSPWGSLNQNFEYDGFGRLQTVSVGGTSPDVYAFNYDDNDLPLSQTTTYAGVPAQEVAYEYFADGSVGSIVSPGMENAFQYDELGRPRQQTVSITGNSTLQKYGWSYYDNGWLNTQSINTEASSTLTNLANTTYTYHGRGLLATLENRGPPPGSSLRSQFHQGNGGMAYDAVGNLTAMTADVVTLGATTPPSFTYGYSYRNQLLTESRQGDVPLTNTFVYDPSGNTTVLRSLDTGAFNARNQRTGVGYEYDGDGNPDTYGGNNLSFDAEDRMTIYPATGGSFQSGYTWDGKRAWKKLGSGAKTYFIYAGSTPVAEIDASGNVLVTNVTGPTGLLSRNTASGSAFYLFDNLGNVVQTIDGAGAVTATAQYDAYGKPTTATAPAPFGYHGQSGYYTDAETGLYLLTHRYYDPEEGRFLTRDPIGYAGGSNLYGYVGGNPINSDDPLGFCEGGSGGRKLWYDRLGDWVSEKAENAKQYYNDHLRWQAAGAVNTGIDLVSGVAKYPQQVGHLGEGTGRFAADSSLENAGGLAGDIATFSSTVAGAAGAIKWSSGIGKPLGRVPTAERLPPGWNENWQKLWPTRNSARSKHWFDESGGEWRWHEVDKHHAEGHWDHNPWRTWNDEWQNVPNE